MSIQTSRLTPCNQPFSKPHSDKGNSILGVKAIAHLALPLLMGTVLFTAPSAQAQARNSNATPDQPQKPNRVRWQPNPERGNASGTLSGGRRGGNIVACGNAESDTSLRLLVPQGKASLLTTQVRPTLAWQIKTQQPVKMELVLSDVQQANPIWTQQFQASRNQTFSNQLPIAAALVPDRQYRWSIVAHCSSGEKTEIYARSFIRLVARESLEEQRSPASASSQLSAEEAELKQALAYAEQGIWYDAASGLLNLPEQVVEGQPADLLAELLGQAHNAAP